MREVRVRFAPSPTGALHIGGVRTALYNFLFARQQKGTFILRIEDTDQTRLVPGAEEYIIEALTWAGIQIDEGVGVGGPHAPYRQSERKEIYQRYTQQLIASGHAYYAFDTEEELEAMRTQLKEKGSEHQQYSSRTRMMMKNSLTLPHDQTRELVERGIPYVVRLKVPENEVVTLHDVIRGEVSVATVQLDDKVLMKSDGMPTYHLANVVDDHLMEISHVIRGEEWLPSAPLHVLLYRYLGWEQTMPQFAHLPLLLKPDGNGKLSKRDADRMGFPIFPINWKDPSTGELAMGFREAGYLPEGLINFLAFLGWNPGTEQEIFSMHELISAFSMERIGKAGARFDIQKAQWFNQQYLRNKSNAELARYLMDSLKDENIHVDKQKAEAICGLLKERITFLSDLLEQSMILFIAPDVYDETVVAKRWNKDAVTVLSAYRDALTSLENLTAEQAKSTLEQVTTALGIATGKILQALRLSITGAGTGPDLMMTIEILGSKETVSRISRAIETLNVKAT